MRSEIAANLNVLEFVQIFGEICKTLGVRWSNRYGVTAPLTRLSANAQTRFFLDPTFEQRLRTFEQRLRTFEQRLRTFEQRLSKTFTDRSYIVIQTL